MKEKYQNMYINKIGCKPLVKFAKFSWEQEWFNTKFDIDIMKNKKKKKRYNTNNSELFVFSPVAINLKLQILKE